MFIRLGTLYVLGSKMSQSFTEVYIYITIQLAMGGQGSCYTIYYVGTLHILCSAMIVLNMNYDYYK